MATTATSSPTAGRVRLVAKSRSGAAGGQTPVRTVNAEDGESSLESAAIQAYATQFNAASGTPVGDATVSNGPQASVEAGRSSGADTDGGRAQIEEASDERANGLAPVVSSPAGESAADSAASSIEIPNRSPSSAIADDDSPNVAPPTVAPTAIEKADPTATQSGSAGGIAADAAIGTGILGVRSTRVNSGTLGPLPRPPGDETGDPVVRLTQRPAIGYEPEPPSPSDRPIPGFASPPANAAGEPQGSSYLDLDSYLDDGRGGYDGEWTWQLLPSSLIYKSYLAGLKESRLASQHVNIRGDGWLWDAVLGGRVGLLRYGDRDPVLPNGWQIDAEGSAQVRLDVTNDVNVRAVDFRGGLPITYGAGRFRTKFGYYHLSSHLGDEFLLEHPGYPRLNYSRDCLVLGETFYITERLRVYAEMAWAFHDDVSKPWEFQFGVDYSPIAPTGFSGAPFFAANGHIRQELDYSGHFTLQTGWAWVSDENGRLLRLGFQYVNGLSTQYSFYNQFEQQVGMGLWYDY